MKKILLVLAAVILTGCGNNPVKEVAYKQKIVIVSVPPQLYETVDFPAPPNQLEYIKLEADEKEDALTVYATQLMISLQKANERLTAIGVKIAEEIKKLKETNDVDGP